MFQINLPKKQLCAFVLSSLFCASSQIYAGEITAYSSLEDDEIADYLKAAKKDLPDVKVNVLRLSTGDLGARILAEKDNPKHDVIWGWSITNMLNPDILCLNRIKQKALMFYPNSLNQKMENGLLQRVIWPHFVLIPSVLKRKSYPCLQAGKTY